MIINGKQFKFQENSNISEILDYMKINKDSVVVEVNLNIIPREDYDNFLLKENDSIEVLSFVGGG